ncbi:hypothetical protein ND748_10670 [Frankia sp. AiPs1]|nr:hypothetical protein [Frankia sp. AiPs1]
MSAAIDGRATFSDDIAEITVASAPHVTTSTRVWWTTDPGVDVGCVSVVAVAVAVAVVVVVVGVVGVGVGGGAGVGVGVAVAGGVVGGDAGVVISVLQVGALDGP